MPTYRSLVEETEAMLKKQRQKGIDYKFRDGPGRPAPLDNNFASAAPAEGAPAAAKAGEAPQPASLDDYDPKEQADKDREALSATVSAMRSEASKLTVDVGDLQRRYETAKIDLAQLAYEDDVDHERAAGLRKMSEVRCSGRLLLPGEARLRRARAQLRTRRAAPRRAALQAPALTHRSRTVPPRRSSRRARSSSRSSSRRPSRRRARCRTC